MDKERMIGRLSPGQEELLYEKEKIRKGEVKETDLESYNYPWQNGYL